ncbi:MAG: phytanoyl-CoA dioxygenase family protein [Alphaproteobacteria bacterium]|nr:phytanoyl-CoA dioxygenase family protein [Alphaproteobacteria bacterium]
MSADPRADLEDAGRLWLRGALEVGELSILDAQTRTDGPGARIDPSPAILSVIGRAGSLTRRLARLLPGLRPVRALTFAKSGDTNWGVPWHQDRLVAVRERIDQPGFTHWTRKDSWWHCEPPANLLARMVFVRLHLDDAGPESGCLELALGTHRLGPLPAEETQAAADRAPQEVADARRGDVLVVKMLTVHRSRRASKPAPRRVLRVDYAPDDAPGSLSWALD